MTNSPTEPKFEPSVQKTRTRHIVAIAGGDIAENYDWAMFGLMAAFIGPVFFPETDRVTATLYALAVFAAGFVARPIGALVLGTAADRFGRRKIMLLSITLMIASATLIACLPTYGTVGVLAPILLLTLRLFQGASMGAETALEATYVVELGAAGTRGRFMGFVQSAVQVGNLLAAFVAAMTTQFLSNEQMLEFGWRIPFALSALLGIIVIWLRRTLPEPPASKAIDREEVTTRHVWKALGKHWLTVVAGVFIIGGAMITNYAWADGLPNLAIATFEEDPSAVFWITTASILVIAVLLPVAGRICDRQTLPRAFVFTRLAVIPLAFLILLYRAPGLGIFIIVMLAGAVILAFTLALYSLVVATSFPAICRTLGVGLSYQLAVVIFGGTAPYLLIWLEQVGGIALFVTYNAVIALISVVLYVKVCRPRQYVDDTAPIVPAPTSDDERERQ